MKKKKWIILAAVLLVAGVFAFLIIRINMKFPSTEEAVYPMNEPVLLSNGVSVRVNGARWLSEAEKFEYNVVETEEGGVFMTAAVSITATNEGTEKVRPELYSFELESCAYGQGLNLSAFHSINSEAENVSASPTLGPGESVTGVFPYTIFEEQFPPEDWEHITEREFWLVINLYPQKQSIRLTIE